MIGVLKTSCLLTSLQHLGNPTIFIFDEERDTVPQNRPGGDDAGAGAQCVSTELRHGQQGAPPVREDQVIIVHTPLDGISFTIYPREGD